MPSPDVRREPGALRALRHRDFALFWTTALISNSAVWMQMVAVPALLYVLTESGTWLGAAAMAMLLPSVVLTPLAGVLADRFPRRAILMCTQLGQMAVSLAFLTLYLLDELSPLRILGLLFTNGLAAGIQVSAWQSFVPTLVPRSALVDAVRLNSVQFQASRAIGPGIGAVTLGLFGFGAAFVINAATFVPVLVALAIIRPNQEPSVTRGDRLRRSLAEGFSFALGRVSLRRTVATGFVISALGQSLIPLAAGIAAEVYGGASTDNTGLVAAIGVGSLVSGILVIAFGDRFARSSTALAGLALYLAGVALIPLTPIYAVGLLAFGICGFAHVPVATSLNTFLQSAVPDRLRGRIVSVYLLGVMLGMPTGSLILGRLGDLIGLREAMALNAAAMALFLLLVLTHFERLRILDADDLGAADPPQRRRHGRAAAPGAVEPEVTGGAVPAASAPPGAAEPAGAQDRDGVSPTPGVASARDTSR